MGLRLTYKLKPEEDIEEEETGISAVRAWIYFLMISVGVIFSGYFFIPIKKPYLVGLIRNYQLI